VPKKISNLFKLLMPMPMMWSEGEQQHEEDNEDGIVRLMKLCEAHNDPHDEFTWDGVIHTMTDQQQHDTLWTAVQQAIDPYMDDPDYTPPLSLVSCLLQIIQIYLQAFPTTFPDHMLLVVQFLHGKLFKTFRMSS
jgi:hypothetical protein